MRTAAASQPARVRLSLAAVTLVAAGALGASGALLVHAHRASVAAPPLPEFHGQATWLPGTRPAPPPAHPGRTAVVAFAGRDCSWCLADVRRVIRLLPVGERPVLTVARPGDAGRYGVTPGRRVLVLVDKNGDERTGYAFPFVLPFVVGDLRTLAAERR